MQPIWRSESTFEGPSLFWAPQKWSILPYFCFIFPKWSHSSFLHFLLRARRDSFLVMKCESECKCATDLKVKTYFVGLSQFRAPQFSAAKVIGLLLREKNPDVWISRALLTKIYQHTPKIPRRLKKCIDWKSRERSSHTKRRLISLCSFVSMQATINTIKLLFFGKKWLLAS